MLNNPTTHPHVPHALPGGQLVPYMLDEKSNWGLHMDNLNAAVDGARAKGIAVRGLVFINPGNPTGAWGQWGIT